MSAHANTLAHWVSQPVEVHKFTACGLDIDGPCDKHAGLQICRYGLAWTRSRDLEKFAHQTYMPKLTPCITCSEAACVSLTDIQQKAAP